MNSLLSVSSHPSLAVGANSCCSAWTLEDGLSQTAGARAVELGVESDRHEVSPGDPVDGRRHPVRHKNAIVVSPEHDRIQIERVRALVPLATTEGKISEIQDHR